MNYLSKKQLLLSFLIDDEDKEKEVLSGYYKELESIKGTTVDPEQLFLDYLKNGDILTRGIQPTDEYCEDLPNEIWIDELIRSYFRYKVAQKCGIGY